MRIGINGMGRIGRLALRAAMGGIYRAADDPRGENRLDVVHINELKGGAATTAHLLEFDSGWRFSAPLSGLSLPGSASSASTSDRACCQYSSDRPSGRPSFSQRA